CFSIFDVLIRLPGWLFVSNPVHLVLHLSVNLLLVSDLLNDPLILILHDILSWWCTHFFNFEEIIATVCFILPVDVVFGCLEWFAANYNAFNCVHLSAPINITVFVELTLELLQS